jgi:diguanylate cyclase (GGDEF)-like protein
VARWGGEEFMVLLPETSPGTPGMAIERLREHLENLPVCPQAPDLRIAFSAGIASFRADESIDEAIARADHALYDAKQAGRNCTVFN